MNRVPVENLTSEKCSEKNRVRMPYKGFSPGCPDIFCTSKFGDFEKDGLFQKPRLFTLIDQASEFCMKVFMRDSFDSRAAGITYLGASLVVGRPFPCACRV